MIGGRHCPFLNRDDPRCAEHFGVNRLQRAFDHCVGDYDRCPAYHAQLDERHRLRGEVDVELAHSVSTMRFAGRVTVTVPLTLRGRNVDLPLHGRLSRGAFAAVARAVGGPTALGAA